MTGKKKISIIALLLLLVCVISATYAYFVAQKGSGGSANINVEAGTTDSLTFKSGPAINITANSDNFAKNKGNQSGETEVSAHLVANNGNYTATEQYYVYVEVQENPFLYSHEENPELILQIIDPEGNAVDTIETKGIDYVTINADGENEIKGFDITTYEGLIAIKNKEEISATPNEEVSEQNGIADETWQIKVIFINLDTDQQVNTGKTFRAQALIQHEEKKVVKTLAKYVTSQYQSQGDNGIYHHDGTLDEQGGINDNSYRYTGSTPNNYVCFGSGSEEYNRDGTGECPDTNLYRIIGVFDNQVKLIKSEYITKEELGLGDKEFGQSETGLKVNNTYTEIAHVKNKENIHSFAYSGSSDNPSSDWKTSELKNALNNPDTNYYLGKLGSWANLIVSTNWKIGNYISAQPPNKLLKPPYSDTVTIVEAKIGLLYPTDYYLATTPENWLKQDYATDTNRDNNWLFNGIYEWMIARYDVGDGYSFTICSNGAVSMYNSNTALPFRPTFYLDSKKAVIVEDDTRDGSEQKPIRIALPE